MGRIVAFDRGDPRNIYALLDGQLEELTPIDDSHSTAASLARGIGARFYLKFAKTPDSETWTVFDAYTVVTWARAFPTRESAIMYAAMKGGR